MRFLATAFLVCAGCVSPVETTLVVVGFRAEPGLETPGRVLVSPDGGVTFQGPEPLGEGEWITEVVAVGDRFLAIGLEGGLWQSDPSGTRWEGRRLHDTWLDAVHAPAVSPGVVLAAGLGAYWKSADDGVTWERRPTPGLYFEDFAFVDPGTGIGVEGTIEPAAGAIWRTADGGETWALALETSHALRAAEVVDGAIWAVGDAGTVVVSTDGGVSWRDRSGPRRLGPVPDFSDLDVSPAGAAWLVGTEGAARAYRGAGLPEGDRWTNGQAGDFVLQGVLAIGGETAWACGYRSYTDRGVILRTRDGGRTWSVVLETPGVFWYSIAGAGG